MRRWAVLVCALAVAASCAYPEFAFTTDGGEVSDTSAEVSSDSAAGLTDTAVEMTDTAVPTGDAADAGGEAVLPDTVPAADTAREADAGGASVTLLARGATWRYLDDGTSPTSSTWRGGGGFDDSKWKSGPAKLGFGDGDERTLLTAGAPDGGPAYVTYYFRRFITVTDAASFATVTIRIRRDDGAVVYFNGAEVARSNMPSGTITSATIAPTTVAGTDEDTFFTYVVPAATLAEGSNVIAAEVHQSSLPSSDLGFDLELVGTKP